MPWGQYIHYWPLVQRIHKCGFTTCSVSNANFDIFLCCIPKRSVGQAVDDWWNLLNFHYYGITVMKCEIFIWGRFEMDLIHRFDHISLRNMALSQLHNKIPNPVLLGPLTIEKYVLFSRLLKATGMVCYCNDITVFDCYAWWRHQMEIFSALLVFCVGNSPVTGEFLSQRPVMRSFDAFFDLCLNRRLSKQSWGWWFERLSRPLWRHCNGRRYHAHCKGNLFCSVFVVIVQRYWML